MSKQKETPSPTSDKQPLFAVLSANPGLDRVLCFAQPTVHGGVNRVSGSCDRLGSKGANAAVMYRRLGMRVQYVTFRGAGETSRFCTDKLALEGVTEIAVAAQVEPRINIKVTEPNGTVTEYNPRGGAYTESELCALQRATAKTKAAVLAICGSLPKGAPTDFYAQVVTAARARGQIVALDTSGAALLAAMGGCVADTATAEYETGADAARKETAGQEKSASARGKETAELAKGAQTEIVQAAQAAQAAQGAVVPPAMLAKSVPQFIKPNLEELRALLDACGEGDNALSARHGEQTNAQTSAPTGESDKTEEAKALCRLFYRRFPHTTLLCTMGALGTLCVHQGEMYRVKAPKVAARGTVGAGDTFFAAFLVALFAHGKSVSRALEDATNAATAKVMLPNGEFPTKAQIDAAPRCEVKKIETLSHGAKESQ